MRLATRRALLAGVGAASAAAIAACAPPQPVGRTGSRLAPYAGIPTPPAAQGPPVTAAAKPLTTAAMSHTPAASIAAVARLTKADEMDQHHEAGVKAFPAKTARQGNERLQPRIVDGVLVFDLTASSIKWEVEAGRTVDAMAYNGMVPGPEIRVTEGDRVRVVLKNDMDESTAIHFHGQRTPNSQDGVPFITQPPIKPGQTFTYEFVARPSGSHMYHSHHNSSVQVSMGLLGAFIVLPRSQSSVARADVEYVMILNDGPHGFTLNGKSFPATQPLTAKVGQRVLIRYMNEGSMIHPMHLHGFPQQVIAKDGYPQQPWLCDTLNISPGDRWDVIVEPDEPGVWAFHCHVLPHAETPKGMFGMVTAMIVTK